MKRQNAIVGQEEFDDHIGIKKANIEPLQGGYYKKNTDKKYTEFDIDYKAFIFDDLVLSSRFNSPDGTYVFFKSTQENLEKDILAMGTIKNGEFTGDCQIWHDTSHEIEYDGEVVRGVYHGQGELCNDDAYTIYDGEWYYGTRHGTGDSYYEPSGYAQYSGEWLHGKYHGKGTLYADEPGQRIIHEGEFFHGAIVKTNLQLC